MPYTKRKRSVAARRSTAKSSSAISDFAKVTKHVNDSDTPAKTLKEVQPVAGIKRKRINQEKEETSTPKKTQPSASLFETPTKGARTALSKLNLFASPPSPSKSPEKCNDDLPLPIQEFINLHRTFLKCLSLHYAHNDVSTPIRLRAFAATVQQSWGKSKVSIEQIRRLVGMSRVEAEKGNKTKRQDMRQDGSQLKITDYGRGMICLDIDLDVKKIGGVISMPINEEQWHDRFVHNIGRLYAGWKENQNVEDEQVNEWIAALPMMPITTCSTLRKGKGASSSLLTKGQKRLEELKFAITAKKAVDSKSKPTKPASFDEPGTSIKRSRSLLERIKSKELARSQMPAPPTNDELLRAAALQKIEEICLFLFTLCSSSSPTLCLVRGSARQTRLSFDAAAPKRKLSYPLASLLQTLSQSLRSPLSRDEGERCLRLLAEEIAPAWVEMVRLGKTWGVVLNVGKQPAREQVLEKVEELKRVK